MICLTFKNDLVRVEIDHMETEHQKRIIDEILPTSIKEF